MSSWDFIAARRGAPWRAEARATIVLAAPLVGTQLAQMSISTIDVLMMGWLGVDALAAGALGAQIYFVLMLFCTGLVMATSPLIAQAVGRRRHGVRDVRRSVRQGWWVALTLGVPCCVIIWHAEALLRLAGQDPLAAAAAQDYAHAMIWGFVPALWFVVLRCFVAALGRPRSALIVMLMAVVANAFGNWVLMFGKFGLPALGLVGAAVASSIVNTMTFILLLGYVMWDRRFRRFHVLGRLWRPDWVRYREIFRIGMPIGATITFEVALFGAAVMLMGVLGTAELAAHQIAIQCAAMAFMVPLGIGQAATVRVGVAAGAGDEAGVRRAGYTALGLGVVFATVMAVVFWTMPARFVALFIDVHAPANSRVVQLAVAFLAIAALFQIVDGLQAIGVGVLRGLKDTRVPMIMAAIGYWVIGFPASALLAFKTSLGGVGVWIGLALGLAVVAAMVVHRFAIHRRLGLVPGPAFAS